MSDLNQCEHDYGSRIQVAELFESDIRSELIIVLSVMTQNLLCFCSINFIPKVEEHRRKL